MFRLRNTRSVSTIRHVWQKSCTLRMLYASPVATRVWSLVCCGTSRRPMRVEPRHFCCCHPSFFSVTPSGTVSMRPMKGTLPRLTSCICASSGLGCGDDDECSTRIATENARRMLQLENDAKERAENLMVFTFRVFFAFKRVLNNIKRRFRLQTSLQTT